MDILLSTLANAPATNGGGALSAAMMGQNQQQPEEEEQQFVVVEEDTFSSTDDSNSTSEEGGGGCLRQMNGIDAETLLALASIPCSSSNSSIASSSSCQLLAGTNCHHDMMTMPTANNNSGAATSWSRSAGRKKSHPVWTFFKDLRDTNGIGGVCCLHCDWAGDDRSPNNLRTHLKRFHDVDGVFKQFTQELALTPTQPYVKRKRHQQQLQQAGQTQHQQQAEQPPNHQPAATDSAHQAAHEEKVPAVAQIPAGRRSPPIMRAAIQPKKRSPSPVTTVLTSQHQGIPHSGAQSAFSKYSTAALLQSGLEGGKKSPAHGAEAPKSRPAQPQSNIGVAQRNAYGLEAITGLNAQQLTMLGLTDPQLLAQLEAAVAMSQLVQVQQQQAEKQPAVTQQPKVTATQSQHQVQAVQQQQQQNEQRALNELLALYAASAAASSALQQQQHQDGLKAKAASQQQQQQQQLAAQQAQAAAWLYNWEWLAAAQRMGQPQNGMAQQQNAAKTAFCSPTLANTTAKTPNTTMVKSSGQQQQQLNGQQQQSAAMAAAAMAAALGIGGLNGTTTASNGQKGGAAGAGPKNGQQQQAAMAADAMLAKAAMSQLLIQAQIGTNKPTQPNVAIQPKAAVAPIAAQQSQQAQKRKSPTTTTAEESGAANSLLVLADTAASTAAVERRMQQQRDETGGSPPKHARKETTATAQSAATAQLGERERALAESLVLYGMHRIAMELQLSYSVHATKGKAEYAFYCANGMTGNANIQKMVTVTESTDQILHIREYANGAVVAEECWPKSAEPYNLLSSLRDKCQRRLCSAQ